LLCFVFVFVLFYLFVFVLFCLFCFLGSKTNNFFFSNCSKESSLKIPTILSGTKKKTIWRRLCVCVCVCM
jgi:hypothetical protein